MKTTKGKRMAIMLACEIVILIVMSTVLVWVLLQDRKEKGIASVNVQESIVGEDLKQEELPTDSGAETGENTEVEPVKPEEEEQKPQQLTMLFAGDVLLDDNYSPMVALSQRGGDIRTCFSDDIWQEMHSADIFMINNEFTFSNRGEPTPEKSFTFRAKPENVKHLLDMGVDIVSLANNHAYDYGEVSLLDSLDILEEAGIERIGAGRNIEEAVTPMVYELENYDVAIIAATQIERLDNPDTKGATETEAGVFRCLNPQRLYEEVQKAKEQYDYVIVYIHWGTENVLEPDYFQLDQTRGLVDAGADLIVGNHAHCLQTVDIVDGVPVIYSLANFWFNSKEVQTCMLKVNFGLEGVESIQFMPALQKGNFTSLLDGAEKQTVFDLVQPENKVLDENGYFMLDN